MIRIGEIGVGKISNNVHLREIDASPDLQLVAICDIDTDALNSAKKQYSIDDAHCFTNYMDLINCPDVDAIDIVTPNNRHFEISMAAAKSGKPICLEKPLTMTAEEAQILEDYVDTYHVKNMLCFSYRFKAAARYARDLVQSGKLGKIYHIDIQYYQGWGIPSANRGFVWRFQKKYAGSGALGDLGSHALDLIRFVSGQEFGRIYSQLGTFIYNRERKDGSGMGKVDVDDYAYVMGNLCDGTAITMRTTRFAKGRGNYQRMEVYGSEGSLVYTLDEEGTGADKIMCCFGEEKVLHDMEIPEKYNSIQMQSFADIVLGKSDGLPATIEDGRINMQLLEMIINRSI